MVEIGAAARMQAVAVHANREFGLGVGAGGHVDLVGSIVAGTLPSDADQVGGTGVSLAGESSATVTAVLFRDNLGVAFTIDHSSVVARGLAVIATGWGNYPEVDSQGIYLHKSKKLADGVLVQASPQSTLDDSVVVGSVRAGIFVDSSPGVAVRRSLVAATGGMYGLVVQKTEVMTETFNFIFGASIQNRAFDAGLSLPQAPALAVVP